MFESRKFPSLKYIYLSVEISRVSAIIAETVSLSTNAGKVCIYIHVLIMKAKSGLLDY